MPPPLPTHTLIHGGGVSSQWQTNNTRLLISGTMHSFLQSKELLNRHAATVQLLVARSAASVNGGLVLARPTSWGYGQAKQLLCAAPFPSRESTARESPTFATRRRSPTTTAVTAVHLHKPNKATGR